MIQSIELLEKCFIANIVKCRPPNNRPPESEEIDSCVKFLGKQIELISPQMLILLGSTAVKGLVPEHKLVPLDVLREASKEGPLSYKGIPAMVAYHPSGYGVLPERSVL
jgi:DNA polymerase